jgi:diguanylate cyclase (GGDEF)-like protein
VSPTLAVSLTPTAEVLLWQSRLRILVASTAAVAEFVLLASARVSASPVVPIVLGATIAYLLMAAASAAVTRRRGSLPNWVMSLTACADVAMIFGLTILFSAPQYYGRVLIFAFLALNLTTFYVGQTPAITGLGFTTVAYPALIQASMSRGAELVWREEMWSLTAFLVAGAVLLVEQRHMRRRLETIAGLFARAEEGDFSESYDDVADARPDAVTQLGRAYNRVRGQLSNLVLTDPLTGCVNRRGFEQALEREVARAARSGSEMAVLALDIDHFKSVNDTMGHVAGDLALREVGAMLMRAARTGDVVARTGGEEFCLVLPDTSGRGAFHVASRICEAVRAHEFRSGNDMIRLTVSIGVVAQTAIGGATREVAEVLKTRADGALYSAKRAGRDRVKAWTPTS